VLEDAVECFMKCIDAATNKGQRLFREADEWITHEDKRWVFSFDNVCDMLDINPDYMRVGLSRWKERKIELVSRRRAEAEAAAANPALPEPAAAAPTPAPTPAKVFAKSAAAVHHREHEHRVRSTHASAKRRRARA